jgi:hypothetical protein
MNSIKNLLITACKTSTVATAAGLSQTVWNNHVFDRRGQSAYSHRLNMGNLPAVEIFESSSSSEFSATGGSRLSLQSGEFGIRIHVAAFANSVNTSSDRAHLIKQAILQSLPEGFALTNFSHNPLEIRPYSVTLDLILENETTQTQNFEE